MDANKYKTNYERMLELIRRLKDADIAYYRDDNPVMSDRDYDALMDELKSLEQDTGLILSGSPTQKVSGENLEELTPVRHTIPSVLTGLKRFCMTLGFLFVLIVKTEYIIKTTDSFTAAVCTNDIFIVLFSRINDILQHRYVSRKTAYGWY